MQGTDLNNYTAVSVSTSRLGTLGVEVKFILDFLATSTTTGDEILAAFLGGLRGRDNNVVLQINVIIRSSAFVGEPGKETMEFLLLFHEIYILPIKIYHRVTTHVLYLLHVGQFIAIDIIRPGKTSIMKVVYSGNSTIFFIQVYILINNSFMYIFLVNYDTRMM